MRHERRTNRPGWPAICPPWRCDRGIHEIVPITSAAGLVEEGNRLDHCVGGYYPQCRSGAVQILSLRRDGTHAATIELTLSGTTADTLFFQVGQFKARRNRRPDDELHDVLRAFLAALNSGAHPFFRSRLAAYRKRMECDGDYLWSARALQIAHARDVFPLYLPLLPRGTPADLNGWCEQTGLTAALDRAAALLSRSA
ncbi:MAG: PcfJ domain-containing protein [Hyphomicrobiales bacterium]|nr:PcfJ domain-containing protein [Hyphomicrobiales bacterium]